MAASNDSDDEETFATLGTPLDIPDEDAPRRKPVSLQDIQAKDSKGRARFHGAFTGGYSAGYFNTVGSQKGWTPSTFVSSREKRAENQDRQKPEDFMDEDDLGEYGIAPRKLVTAGTFSSEERKRRRQDELKMASSDAIIPGEPTLLNLIVPERITIGVKLLRKMGWKEGQGVGPRLNKKQKKREKAGMKVYGCAMPPSPDSDDDIDDETFLSDVTYAPKDNTQIFLSVKTNTHGLGYRGLDPRNAFGSSHVELFKPPPITKSGRKGIRGQAFGVGALEEDDDDIYGVDDMSNYDMTMGDEGQDGNFGWTAPRKRGPVQTPVGYVGELLEGFKLSSAKLVQKKLFPPPELPRGFRPVHVFSQPQLDQPEVAQQGIDYRQFLRPDTDIVSVVEKPTISVPDKTKSYSDATSRSLALGEQAFVGSVFDLISKEDKERMTSSKSSTHSHGEELVKTSEGTEKQHSEVSDQTSNSSSKLESFSSIEDQRKQNVPLFQGGAEFKPFMKNPQKQERYDRYLALVKQGCKDPYAAVMGEGQTEWEGEREKEEFSKAARLYKPLAGMMAMRFTTGSQLDDASSEAGKEIKEAAKSDAMKAAEMKMYGKLTREVLEWHPDRLVCKRFNVPDPYPGSNIVGLASVKRDKYSVFTFLNFANTTHPDHSTQSQEETKPKENSEKAREADNKVEKELNKSKTMKSIFSHLVEPQDTAAKKTGLSFTVKSAKPKQQKAFKSIFSHLDGEDDKLSKKPVAMETDVTVDTKTDSDNQREKVSSDENLKEKDVVKEANSGTGNPGMDLFRAVFRNTDSEDSSSSESEEEIVIDKTVSSVSDRVIDRVDKANDSVDRVKDSVDKVKDSVDKVKDSVDKVKDSVDKVQQSPVSRSDDRPRQDVQHLLLTAASQELTLPGSSEKLPSLEQRLSPDVESEDSESYGPSLPPSQDQGTSTEIVENVSQTYIDLTRESSKKYRHKDRHKSKKDKKEKHKKSKHKKKQKKKDSKKKKHRKHESSDSTDSSDSEDNLDGMPSDRDLLNRMKMLNPRKRASDYF